MIAAKRGDRSLLADFETRMGLPSVAGKINLTEIWAKAASGDKLAKEKLENMLKV